MAQGVKKPPGPHVTCKKKPTASLVRSSAAEYLHNDLKYLVIAIRVNHHVRTC
jgi:hypothetical protein